MAKIDDIPTGWGTLPKRREARRAKHLGALTWDKLIAIGAVAGTTEGQRIIAEFCVAVESGNVPNSETLQFIARGLRPFLSDRDDTETKARRSARTLGVTKKQGKRKIDSIGEIEPYARSVLEYQNLAASLGEVEARRRICKKYGIGDRAMRNRIRDYGHHVPVLRELDIRALEAERRK